MLNGKGGAELDDKEETILEGEFVDGMLEGKVRIFFFLKKNRKTFVLPALIGKILGFDLT